MVSIILKKVTIMYTVSLETNKTEKELLYVTVADYNPVHSTLFTHNSSAASSSRAGLFGVFSLQSAKYLPT